MRTRDLEAGLIVVLERVWKAGIRTKSNFARAHADAVAIASDRRLITTQLTHGDYGRSWYITPEGLVLLWKRRKSNPSPKKGRTT
jgi:hypothetical protein